MIHGEREFQSKGGSVMNDDRSPPDSPRLTIVIPCHNRADLLRRCLTSVERHSPAATEVLVIDDCSPNRTASRVAAEFTGVRVLLLDRRGGFCAAVNRGIAEARAPIVELLNDDTEVEPDWADAALSRFDDPNVSAVAPLVLMLDGRPVPRIDSAGDSYHLGGFAQKRGHGQTIDSFPLRPSSVFGASGSSAFYRAERLRSIGGFPESFGSYFEDVDVAFRLRRAGGDVVFEPRSRVWHRVNASYGPPSRRLAEQQSRNEERVFWRNIPVREMWRALPIHIAVLLAKACLRWQEGRLLPFLIGRLRTASEARELLRYRRRLALAEPANWAGSMIDRSWRRTL
jgi:GT2 family glycosyltransferase